MSVEVVAVASWGPRWVCWRGHPGVSSPCAWVSLQPGGWIPRACIPRENLVLEVTQNHFCYFFFFFFLLLEGNHSVLLMCKGKEMRLCFLQAYLKTTRFLSYSLKQKAGEYP